MIGIEVTLATAARTDCLSIIIASAEREDKAILFSEMDSNNRVSGEGTELG